MADADILVSCPYNPAHRIRKYKLMNHISKCKKTSRTEHMIECPLDKSHIVNRDLLKAHIEMCPSIGRAADMDIGDIQARDPEPPIAGSLNANENWEDDPEVPQYDPMEVSSKKPVLRCLSGLTKSEKKKFKESERMRIANLKGLHTVSTPLEPERDTAYDAPLRPLRPPRGRDIIASQTTAASQAIATSQATAASKATASPIRILQNDFNKMKVHENEEHDYDDDHNIGACANVVPEFYNSPYHKMLYDELVPKDDEVNHFERSLRNTNTSISLKDYFQQVTRENRSFSTSDRNQNEKRTEVRIKNTEMNSTSKPVNVDNMKEGKDESIANTSSASNGRVTDTLLDLLKNGSNAKKQPMADTMKTDQINKNNSVKGPLDEIFDQFNERLAYLNDIQHTAAEESARLSEQMKGLKELRDNYVSRLMRTD